MYNNEIYVHAMKTLNLCKYENISIDMGTKDSLYNFNEMNKVLNDTTTDLVKIRNTYVSTNWLYDEFISSRILVVAIKVFKTLINTKMCMEAYKTISDVKLNIHDIEDLIMNYLTIVKLNVEVINDISYKIFDLVYKTMRALHLNKNTIKLENGNKELNDLCDSIIKSINIGE